MIDYDACTRFASKFVFYDGRPEGDANSPKPASRRGDGRC